MDFWEGLIMSIKKVLRKFTKQNTFFEKIWIVLQWQRTRRLARRYSDFEYAQKLWKKHTGEKNDFSNPKKLDEKMWFLKLSNRDPLLTICSDKHRAREYVKECGYENILKHEYAYFNSADEIDFSKLPSPCYLKCNHASGMNYIYYKDKKINEKHLKWKFNYLLSQQPYYLSREWNYKNIEPKIVCEEVLEMPDGMSDIPELQFFCFNGEVKFIIYNLGLADKEGRHKDPIRWALWSDWTLVPASAGWNYDNTVPEKPNNYDYMFECATKMSAKFPFVRVDLFNINGKVYFNEFTFYSGGGFTLSKTDVIQNLGEYIDVLNYKIAEDSLRHRNSEDIKNGN